MSPQQKKPRLGRGLASLIGSSAQLAHPPSEYTPVLTPGSSANADPDQPGARIRSVPSQAIRVNPHQPRRAFDETALADLARSIRRHGILQPVLVRQLPQPDGDILYELIAGERRLRASVLADVLEIPCIVRPTSGREMLELALIENIHRADLNPIDRAGAYRGLMDQFSLTQQDVADRIGEPRATIANHLRLLDLPDGVQACVAGGALSFGHAKVIAGLAGNAPLQLRLAEQAVRHDLSVRRVEELARAAEESAERAEGQTPPAKPPYLADLERQLSEALATKVTVRPARRKGAGVIKIEYYSLEDFDRLVAALGITIES